MTRDGAASFCETSQAQKVKHHMISLMETEQVDQRAVGANVCLGVKSREEAGPS